MTDVSGLTHVYLMQNRTEGVWWTVGVFATTEKAIAYRDKYYADEAPKDLRIQRRVVQ